MIVNIFILSLVYICLVEFSFEVSIIKQNILTPLEPSEPYTHDVSFDEDDEDLYKLFWKNINTDEILFEIHCRTIGWVGLGFSPNGNMEGSIINRLKLNYQYKLF